MVALVDYDSILYSSVYKIVSFSEMRLFLLNHSKEDARQLLLSEVYERGINRSENMLLEIQNYLSDVFFEEIVEWEIYITTCKENFRYQISKEYKAKRKKNNYVYLLREHYKDNGVICSNELEADDLIADRAKELGIGNYIIISIDKDLKTIGGYYWSYRKQRSKDMYGEFIKNEYGNYETEYQHKMVQYISESEAKHFFYEQMLVGDSVDNIKGVYGIGKVKAEKLLSNSNNYFITTAREYLKRGMKQEFRDTYKLISLGNPLY